MLSGDIASDIEDLTEITNSLAAILASALDRETIDTVPGSGKHASDELEMAGKLQSRILPKRPPTIDGWDLDTKLLPAHETSGNFYDFIPLPNDKWGILIVDVTDNELGAAVFMARCSTLIRTYAVRFPTLPALALSSVNEKILKYSPGDFFVMYTDIITEAHNRDGTFFIEPRLQASIRRYKQLPAAELLEAILAEVNEFTHGAPDQDDMALVVLSRKG